MKMIENDTCIKAFWYSSNNFGDALNFWLLSQLSGKHVIHTNLEHPHYMAIGSILVGANRFSTVWGAGIANQSDEVNQGANILAVRGLKSLQACIRAGYENDIACGDPALLMPEYYKPDIKKAYRVGVIPHFLEMEPCVDLFGNDPDTLIINPMLDIFSFAEAVMSCERILSSSLHGLIVADAYKVPSAWISLGVAIGGDGTKFQDYYSNTGDRIPMITIDHPTKALVLKDALENCYVKDQTKVIQQLKTSCPWKQRLQ